VEQGNFDTYLPMRIDEVPVIETHLVESAEVPGRHRRDRDGGRLPGGGERDLRRHRQAPLQPAVRYGFAEVVILVLVRDLSKQPQR
jgi:hypothetical protein